MKTRIYAGAVLAAASVACFFMFFHHGYRYNKNDLVIPPGVTCQMQVKSYVSEGSGGFPAVLSDLKTEKAAIDARDANAVYSSGNTLIADEGSLTQNMPPGCVPLKDFNFYETSVNPVDKANADSDEILYLLRAGKPLGSHLAAADRDFTTAISVIGEAMNRLTAYAK